MFHVKRHRTPNPDNVSRETTIMAGWVRSLNISVSKLLGKMEAEIKLAKGASSQAQLRERVQAIKTLTELVLEEPSHFVDETPATPTFSQPQQITMNVSQPKRLKMDDDEANGESLLDF